MGITLFMKYLRPIRPLFLFAVVLLYLLGMGMAGYNNELYDWNLALLGLFWVSALQLGGSFLFAYFVKPTEKEEPGELRDPILRPAFLLFAYTFLAILASLSVMMLRVIEDPVVFVLMLVMVCGVIGYTIPPIQFVNSGYGELVLSLLLVNFTPALGFIIQGGDSIRLLTMVTFPLTGLHMAMLLVFSLASYASDMRLGRRTMLLRMGWQNGMLVHNILILSAYLLIMLAITFDLPWQVGIPALLTLPIGLLQIWTINRIAAGHKPQWNSLRLMAMAIFGITTYLITFSFWIRYMDIAIR
jgi:1,4-dihydroxy-2-naphthoate octaprenyltransferase